MAGSTEQVHVAYGDEELVVAGTAVGFTAAELTASVGGLSAPCTLVVFQCGTNPMRMLYSGGTPTASTGIRLLANEVYSIEGKENIAAARFIREASSSTISAIFHRS